MAANNLVNTKADFISAIVQKELTENAPLAMLASDYSALAVKGVKTIELPKLSGFTVQTRTLGSEFSAENTALTDSVDSIALDQIKGVFWGYDADDAMQSTIDYQMMAAQRAASAHIRNFNAGLIAKWEAVADLNINAGVPADVTIDDLLAMREDKLNHHADMANVAYVIGPDQEKVILKMSEFSRYDYRGDGVAPVVTGTIGKIYGIPVVVHTDVKAQQVLCVEKSGLGFAFQKAPNYAEENNIAYGSNGKKAVLDTVYGIGGLQLDMDGAASGKSPLIAKLID